MTVKGVYNVHQLANEINRMLKEYGNGVGEQVELLAETVAKRGANKLKLSGSFADARGKYRKGWRAKKVGTTWVVHNATDYRLTHLLENGHALAGGGRSKSFPHIRAVETEMMAEFESEIREVLSR
jgi:hypothetical protein